MIITSIWVKIKGYIEKEIVKEAEIDLEEGDQTCEAPKQRDMIQLEVNLDIHTRI